MDENAAIKKISELEDRLKELNEQRNNFEAAIDNYREFVRAIPRNLGTGGEVCTPKQWVVWAKEKLGYHDAD